MLTLKIKSGDKHQPGLGDESWIQLEDNQGNCSRPHQMSTRTLLLRKGDEHLETIDTTPTSFLGRVNTIHLWRSGCFNDRWYIEVITVEDEDSGDKSVFPIHRWIPSSSRALCIEEFDSCIPQYSKRPQQRRRELEHKRFHYELKRCEQLGSPFVQLAKLPEDECFFHNDRWDLEKKRIRLVEDLNLDSHADKKWERIADIMKLYTGGLHVPKGSINWEDDKTFGELRIRGPNPKTISRCEEIPEQLPVDDDMVGTFLEGFTLAEALEHGRLFEIKYGLLHDIFPESDERRNLVCAPVALFFINGEGDLMPIAIQLEQIPAEDNPVFLPSDPKYTWMLAKMWFNLADSIYHLALSHTGFTHLIMEPYCVSAHRHLSPSHPIFKLVAPHFMNLLAMNSIGLPTIINPDGWADETLAAGSEGLMEVMRRAYDRWLLRREGDIVADVNNRRVYPDALPYYPYRDNASLVYVALKAYVEAIVTDVYQDHADLRNDFELQAWARELVTPYEQGGCDCRGVPGNGSFHNHQDLIDTLTAIIFICSVEHAAVSGPQYDYYGFPPCYPFWLDNGRPTTKDPLTEADICKALPSQIVTRKMMMFTNLFCTKTEKPIGEFEVQYAYDPVAVHAAEALRVHLKKIEKVGQERLKAKEGTPYPFLLPSEISNSLNI